MTKKEFMYNEVERYMASGLTQFEFTDDADYSIESLKYWIKKYKKENPEYRSEKAFLSGGFHEIHLSDQKQASSEKLLEITTKSGAHIIIYH